MKKYQLVDEFIRDITKVMPMSKSEARRRLKECIKSVVPEVGFTKTPQIFVDIQKVLKHNHFAKDVDQMAVSQIILETADVMRKQILDNINK